MGRTIPTYRQLIQEEIKNWMKYAETLPLEDRKLFYQLISQCRKNITEAANTLNPTINEAILMTLIFQQQKQIRKLQKEIEKIKQKIDQTSNI